MDSGELAWAVSVVVLAGGFGVLGAPWLVGLAGAQRWWLTRPVVGMAMAVVAIVSLAGLGWRGAVLPVLLAMVAATAAALVDAASQRLPDAIVLRAYIPVLIAVSAAAALERKPWVLAAAVAGMSALWLFYLVLTLINPTGMGWGDVKLAGLLGVVLGLMGLRAAFFGAGLAFVLAASYALIVLVVRGRRRTETFPLGPFMVIGAAAGIITS